MLHDPQQRLQQSLKRSSAKADHEHLLVSTLDGSLPSAPVQNGLMTTCCVDGRVLLLLMLLVSLLLPL